MQVQLVRYPRELRGDPQQIAREVLVPTMERAQIPLGQLAKVAVAPMVDGMISSTVLTLAVIPAIYALVKQWRLGRGLES